MGVFKEHAHAFEAVEKKQKQIYNDACDYGYSYNTKNPPDEIKLLIEMVNDAKRAELVTRRIVENIGTKKDSVTVTICIGWEIDEGMECGTKYEISYFPTLKHHSLIDKSCNAFICVKSCSYREPIK